MEKHFLEGYNTHNKPDALRAGERKELRTEERNVVSDRSERIVAYVERLENIFLNPDLDKRERNLELLKPEIYARTIIKEEDFPDEYFAYQKRLLKDRGMGDVDFDQEARKQEIETVQEKQRKSLEAWIDHLASDNCHYPADIKYFVAQGIFKLGAFDQDQYRFGNRLKSSTASFPQIDHEALATTMGALEAVHHHKDTSDYPEKLLDLINRNKDFGSMYAEVMRFLDTEAGKDKALAITEGEWRIFPKGSDPKELVEAFAGKRAYLCLGNIGDASGYIDRGDVHVYFSNNRAGQPVWPRVALATDPELGAYELRGTFNRNEDVDPEIARTDIVKDYLTTIQNGESFMKKDADMRLLTSLTQKQAKHEPFTKEDLTFLYEINSPIEGFGYEKDPRIAELRSSRNRQEDIATLCDCPPEYIADSVDNINEQTQVFCLDKGDKISLVDFRLEKNKNKLPQIIEFTRVLKETGTPASLDLAIEGGIVNLELDQTTQEALRSYQTATAAFEAADSTPTYIYDELKNIPWTPPALTSLNIHILNHGSTTSEQRDQLVSDMDRAGYRPLTFSELVALGIVRPDLNKRDEILNTYEKHSLDGKSPVPCLYWYGGGRELDASWDDDVWSERRRFLFVRK